VRITGHAVKLMPPKYVKAYVKRGKTDAGNAAAICEAVARPSITFVPAKGVEQQGLSMLHSACSQLIGQRTQMINAVRGHLSEFGIVAESGLLGFAELSAIVRDEKDRRLPATARAALMVLVRYIEAISAEIAALDTALRKENKVSELGPRLEAIPSVGPVTASAFRARVTDPKLYKNGRHLSTWIGIVAGNDSTGGKVKQKGLSKKGDRYLRSLLVNGAMAVVAPGADPPRQATLGHQAAQPHVGQASGDRDRQQDRTDRLGRHGPRRRLRGRPSRGSISSRGVRGVATRVRIPSAAERPGKASMRRRGVIDSGLLAYADWGTIGDMPMERPSIPTEERKPAWRRACLATVRCARRVPAISKRTRRLSRG
jgi:transposase